jgi:hypothetical protein
MVVVVMFCSCADVFFPLQSKKVEKEAVSSSEDEETKEKKITVAYKSTRSAVSWNLFIRIIHEDLRP